MTYQEEAAHSYIKDYDKRAEENLKDLEAKKEVAYLCHTCETSNVQNRCPICGSIHLEKTTL